MPAQKRIIDAQSLRNRLKLKSLQSERKLLTAHTAAAQFFAAAKLRPGQIRQHASKLLTSGALASTLLLSTHTGTPAAASWLPTDRAIAVTTPASLQQELVAALVTTLPPVGQWALTSDQEEEISKKLKSTFGLNASAELEGNRLNNAYGRMGAEQHLPRYPGDSAAAHTELVEKGITPGLGGWGYVGDFQVEKYYVAVQTLYLPNWKTDTARLVKWYKFRRVVVVNPANGKTIVAAVADAGPADWTGKHFGGSPEVMAYLGINYGMQNHPVVLFFLDDPENKIPLGPVEYNVVTGNPALTNKA